MNEKTLRVLEFDKIREKLCSLTASSLGRELAEDLLPETSLDKVRKMIAETDEASGLLYRRGTPPLGGIRDIRGTLKRVELGAILDPGELLNVAGILRACKNLKRYFGDDSPEEYPIIGEAISSLKTNRKLEEHIELCIVSEDEIADDASSTLSSIRRQIRDAQESIKDKLNDIIRSSRFAKALQENIVTIREGRYVVPVKAEHRGEIPGLVHDSSASGATIFIEPMAVVEANNHIKQLKIKEQQEIQRILSELTSEVNEFLEPLKANVSILARLDFIFAKGKLSLDLNCTSPKMNDKGYLNIKKGRHPLLDQKKVVPTDIWLGKDFHTLVITGPNTGGKTVTLKTLGLFTLMAQSGLHVPANDGTELCVFEKVFADIGDEQSIEQSLSTFSSHMTNIVNILSQVDDRSLVLFDELGAGTDPTEGAALAMAILEYLHQVGCRTAATTHYSELKVYAISTAGVENACCEFDVETLRPTYRLLIGIPGKSNAFAISRRLGLPEELIYRAREFISQEDIRFEDMISEIEQNRIRMEEEKTAALRMRQEIERMKNEIEAEKRQLEEKKEAILRDARIEARRILKEAKEESDQIIQEMKKLLEKQEEENRKQAMEEARAKLKSKLNRLDDSIAESVLSPKGYVKPPKNLKPGDTVLIVNLNQKGTVVVPPGDNKEAIVQVGVMKINVHVTNLKLIEEQKAVTNQITSMRNLGKAKTISPEIDLRGQMLDEAIANVDKYLDDASLSGLKEVFIIHGKGTGALRSGIHQMLRSNPHVSSFRLGKFGEGDSGVTIVELK